MTEVDGPQVCTHSLAMWAGLRHRRDQTEACQSTMNGFVTNRDPGRRARIPHTAVEAINLNKTRDIFGWKQDLHNTISIFARTDKHRNNRNQRTGKTTQQHHWSRVGGHAGKRFAVYYGLAASGVEHHRSQDPSQGHRRMYPNHWRLSVLFQITQTARRELYPRQDVLTTVGARWSSQNSSKHHLENEQSSFWGAEILASWRTAI